MIPELGPSSSGEVLSPLLSAKEKADGETRSVVGWGRRLEDRSVTWRLVERRDPLEGEAKGE